MKSKSKLGLPPGSLVYTGPDRDHDIHIDMYVYNASNIEVHENIDIPTISKYRESEHISWVNINGIHDPELIEKIGQQFGIHSLILEDILNIKIRPKLDDFGDYLHVTCKMIYFIEETLEFETINLLMGKNFVVSFQEIDGDVFDSIRKRVMKDHSKIRNSATDFLFYALIDATVDHYFVVLEKLGERIDELEEKIRLDGDSQVLHEIYSRKKNIIRFRKSVYPLREIVSDIEKSENDLFKDETVKYIRDLYDHTIQVIETSESYRELISSLTETYMSALSNRMNNVMKVLTIIATIFIPLTFIAGIYGMNFEYMPELSFKYGYFTVWIVMLIIGIVMIIYFRKKNWL
ncbi:MAG: magnesium/cobalt transporter CorA [Chitinophagales bacterium]|nr:magnesium/cobalt transporter CorA [Chitinophagales bacterium]